MSNFVPYQHLRSQYSIEYFLKTECASVNINFKLSLGCNVLNSTKQVKTKVMIPRVDPLTSILAVLARSCQILTTSWQPWIPWQDSY